MLTIEFPSLFMALGDFLSGLFGLLSTLFGGFSISLA